MKRSSSVLLIVLLIITALTGCGPKQGEIQDEFLAMLDKPPSEESAKEAADYLDQHLSKLDKEYASFMVHELEHYILGVEHNKINYTEWIAHYEKYVDPALTGLYQIMAQEQKSPMAVDTVLKISWEELAKRAYDMENYIKENKDYEMINEDFTWIYGNYINAMIMGTNGTPIFNYKTHAFSEDARTAYVSFINRYPDSITTWVLKEYYTYLTSIQFTMDYNDKVSSKLFFDTCDWLVLESGKRVMQ
ncbi:MAG: hypothetical protein PHV71_06430 [Eubacteriales bacterium]|nr:hypothetical protein [Eubacteriales bacterium]MDD3199970.1 hypothetical protein [Eubacteriales bacterium]MDD4121817.1 hypothetical protein [Eubacteriales bacterium]MDD4630207.1 hypothetical protein [Eubacteriales bacterium]